LHWALRAVLVMALLHHRARGLLASQKLHGIQLFDAALVASNLTGVHTQFGWLIQHDPRWSIWTNIRCHASPYLAIGLSLGARLL
jgi:hypothetical protein